MKLKKLYFLLLLTFSAAVYGQAPSTPSPEEERRIEQRRQQIDRARQEAELSRLRKISERESLSDGKVPVLTVGYKLILKPSKEDRQRVSIPDDVAATYEKFLKQDNTGIVRLHDAGFCSEQRSVINVKDNCPDGYREKAVAYSFRNKDYQWRHFSDVFLQDAKLYIKGFLVFGVLGSLGEPSLNDLNLSSDGVKQLYELNPATKLEEYENHSKIIAKGVQVKNHIFSSHTQLKSGQTYVLRAVAFDGAFKSRRSKSAKPLFWEEDNRDDVIVVFQAVRENDDRSWIILWKELSRKNAPKLDL